MNLIKLTKYISTALVVILLGSCGSSGNSVAYNDEDNITMADLEDGGYSIKLNAYNFSDERANENDILVHFCADNKFKEIHPTSDPKELKGTYTVDTVLHHLKLTYPEYNDNTFDIFNGRDDISEGTPFRVEGEYLDYNFTITENTLTPTISCE